MVFIQILCAANCISYYKTFDFIFIKTFDFIFIKTSSYFYSFQQDLCCINTTSKSYSPTVGNKADKRAWDRD